MIRKIFVTFVMLFLLAGASFAGDKIFEGDVYIGTPDCSLSPADYLKDLVAVDMQGPAGYITNIAIDADDSDEYSLYIYRMDIDNWYTHADRDDAKKLVFFKSYSSSTGRVNDTAYTFSCDSGDNLYIGIYNTDAVDTATVNIHLDWVIRDVKRVTTVTADEQAGDGV